jgi:hypothetical protein
VTLPFRLEAGPVEAPTDLLGDTYTITIGRGLAAQGLTSELDPAVFTAIVKGGTSTNPLTNDDVRPERPVRLLAGVPDGTGTTWHTVFTGKIQRARIEYDPDRKGDVDAYRLTLTGTDLVEALAAAPSEVAVSGSLTQRVDAVMSSTGLPYAVADNQGPTSSTVLPAKGRTVVEQLRLIRDTLHARMFVDRAGVLQAVADNTRPRGPVEEPTFVASDQDPDAVHYNDLSPGFDTSALVNVITIEKLAEGDSVLSTYIDEDSRAAWGAHPQTVAVNGGVAETHADLYLESRTDPELRAEGFSFIVDDDSLPQHRLAAATIDINDTVRVERLGIEDSTQLVHDLAHTITPTRWTVVVGLEVPEVLATRWMDVPADLTWADVPPDLTWRDAVRWRPYL